MTLAEFLNTCITEDEDRAKRAIKWGFHENGQPKRFLYSFSAPWSYSPHKVLAECAAKRRIVELHEHDDPCPLLRALAVVYADHPDYQQEWAL